MANNLSLLLTCILFDLAAHHLTLFLTALRNLFFSSNNGPSLGQVSSAHAHLKDMGGADLVHEWSVAEMGRGKFEIARAVEVPASMS